MNIQVVSTKAVTPNTTPINPNNQPASRCVLSQDNLLDRVQGVRTPTNQLGRILPMKLPITRNSADRARNITIVMSTCWPNAANKPTTYTTPRNSTSTMRNALYAL